MYSTISNPWTIILDTLLATFGNVHDAPILLPAILHTNLITNRDVLVGSIISKYKDDVLGQVFDMRYLFLYDSTYCVD